ncbi:unnamed protein product [Closterium sp. NIES-53]
MYLMTCTRPDLAYPLSILARYVAPGRHRPEHMAAAKRVLRYLCSTSGLGLVLGGRRPVVLTGHADASWADDQATQRSSQGYTFSLGSGSVSWRSTRSSSILGSSCEAEIYAGAMAAQELRWLTYLLTDLGEPPRSPPVLYVDNKAMLALCREHRLEHRTKHIALRYFLARELQERGQLRLAYVASQANTADVFTKALSPGDHQRFCTMLACFALLDWSCDLLFSPTLPMGVFLLVPNSFIVHAFLFLHNEAKRPRWAELLRSGVAIFDLDYDAILAAMYALSISAEGDCYLCVPPDPGIEAAALGASESALPGTSHAEALHTFTLDSGASRCFFRDSTTLTPLSAPVPVRLADPSSPVAPPCSCRLLSHQTLLRHHHLGHPSLPCLRGMHSRLCVSCLPRSLPPLPPSPALPCLPCVEGQQRAAPHSSSFPPTTAPLQTLYMDVWGPARVSGQGRERYFLLVVNDYTHYTTIFPLRSKDEDLPVLRLHSDRGGEFSFDLLRDFCRGEGILQSFTLPASPQQNWISERRIGLVIELPCLLAKDLAYFALDREGWRCVGVPGLGFLCLCSQYVRGQALRPRYFLHLPWLFPDAPGWRFYHPTSHRVLPSEDVTFDESVPFYRLFPYRSAPPPPPPLFPAPSGVSQVDPLPGTMPVEVAVDSGAARGASSGGAEPGGAEPAGVEPGGAESEGAGSGGAEPGVAKPGGAEPEHAEPGGAEPEGAEPGGAESVGVESRGAELGGTLSPRGPPSALSRREPLSPPQLRERFSRRTRLRSRAAGVEGACTGGIGAAGAGGAAGVGAGGTGAGATQASGVAVIGAGGPVARASGGTGATGPGGARTGGTGAAGAGGAVGFGAGDPAAGDTGAGGAGPGGVGDGSGDTGRPRPYFDPLPPLQPVSPLPAPSPYTEHTRGLTERREPMFRPALPVRNVRTGRRVPRPHPPPVPGTHHMALPRAASPTIPRLQANIVTEPSFESATASALVAELVDFAAACRLDYAASLVAESESDCPPSVGGECALGMDASRIGRRTLNAPDIPSPRSYAEAITGPYSSHWQTAMDAKMASWKSTGTYVDAIPPPGANIVDGMWIFRGVDFFQTFSPTPKMTTLRVLLHVAAQRDYELHSLDFSIAFLQGSLHEEILLHHPPGFTGLSPAGAQWILRRPVYVLRQAPREWHDTIRTTLAALGFAPSTTDPSLFLCTDTSLPPFYVIVYINDLVFATADTEALALVKSELQKRHSCTDLGELRSYLACRSPGTEHNAPSP